jgi:ABC-type antimicrobial peptide transport system permease subunit
MRLCLFNPFLQHYPKEFNQSVPPNQSPLEYLAAFAIAFLAGVISAVGISKYIQKIKRDVWNV